jgi:hypothetical protein
MMSTPFSVTYVLTILWAGVDRCQYCEDFPGLGVFLAAAKIF